MAASSRQDGGFLEAAKMAASLIVQDKNTTDVVAQPDEKRAQLLTLAATAADLSELAEKLKPFFPSHDVALQLRRCREWRRKRQLAEPEPTARAFIDWMLLAEIPLPPPKHKPPPAARHH